MEHQRILGIIVLSLMSLNIYVATIPESPRWLIILFGALAIVSQIIKDQFKLNGSNTTTA